jgi:hypothetical protein
MEKIISLYASGLSQKDIHNAGYAWRDIKVALRGRSRLAGEAARLSSFRRMEANKHILSQAQRDLIYGSLLGDSSLSSYGPAAPEGNGPKYTIVFSNSHCDAQFGYVEHMKSILPMGNIYTRIQDSGYKIGNPVHRFAYRNKGALGDIWDHVMVERKKTVTAKWILYLTPAALAYWFMDDGTSCFVGNSVVVRFSTYSFSLNEINLLRSKLQNFGFTSFVQESKHGPVISLSRPEVPCFMQLVESTVSQIPCMQYKIKFPGGKGSSSSTGSRR